MREFTLWGLPRNSTDRIDEQILTSTTDEARIETVKQLAAKQGWHSFRVQILDGTLPDFAGTINPA